jgi:hypothetical protein
MSLLLLMAFTIRQDEFIKRQFSRVFSHK